ncbi:DUF5324 family protein [Carbonactinospora thermoautotrophica]|uniref:DUF5324 family protein n=1 Tax=Carbonactinospora thermoautotrophica TaxID=1469144 RepID=UPI00082EA8E8|nr:DUF5324 family protein [Carbonactinospora thermoautotrophica]
MSPLHAARDKAAKTMERLAPRVATTRESVAKKTKTENVRDWTAPRLESAREKMSEARERVQEDIIPRIGEAVSGAITASQPVRHAAKERGSAAFAALKGEVTASDLERIRKKPRHRMRKMFFIVGLAGVAAAVWAWWRRQVSPDWIREQTGPESSVGPTARSSGPTLTEPGRGGESGEVWASRRETTSTQTTVSTDAGGASPDEALADTAEQAAEAARSQQRRTT